MLLLDLLGVLILGLTCCLVSHILDVLRPVFRYVGQHIRKNPSQKRRRMQITNELDELLSMHEIGLLDEQEYFDQANELIDQLADMLHSRPSGSSNTRHLSDRTNPAPTESITDFRP